MGFVLLGLAAATPTAVAGAVLQMVSHGIIAGLLFAVVGRMVYERTHTRQLERLRQLPLHRLMPFAAVIFVIAGLASMGLPGFSGFPAELTILVGVWQYSQLAALAAALGIVVAAGFTLKAVQVSFFGRTDATVEAVTAEPPFEPVTWPEQTATLLIGLKPDLVLDWITPSLQSPLLQAIWQGGGR
jgi:NADH-quinone oxidoreductase subunit M